MVGVGGCKLLINNYLILSIDFPYSDLLQRKVNLFRIF